MKMALTVVMVLALVPQVVFTIRYWRKLPAWIRHPYGRLAQLGCWCHILLLTLYLAFVWLGMYFNPLVAKILLVSAFVPLIFYGLLQLKLLERAVKSSTTDKAEQEEEART